MFTDAVVPLLQRVLPAAEAFACRTLRTTGLGESQVQQEIETPLQPLVASGLEVGYCARPGSVDVRLTARGDQAAALVSRAEAAVRGRLGTYVFTSDDEEIEAVVIRLLAERQLTLSLAESCTGGCLAHRLTNVPGASAVVRAGWVTYSNDAKQQLLGVRAATLARHGAVSEPVAREMAAGARRLAQTDFALGVTGIAGPDGGTPEKSVGTVFISLACAQGTQARRFYNPWDRLTFKEVTAQQALDWLRRQVSSDEFRVLTSH